MSEDDLLGQGVREPLRTCCVKLAGRLWALLTRGGAWDNVAGLQARAAVVLCARMHAGAACPGQCRRTAPCWPA